MHMYEKLMREDRTGFENMAEVHNTLSEDLSFNRVIRLAANIEGAALYMMHTSAKTGVDAIAAARAKGVPIYGETLHQYLMYTAEDYRRPNGQIYHTYPSLKFREDQEALWQATDHGAIQTVATDEICCPLRIKLQGRRIDDTTGGNAGVEPRLSLIYTETVEKRGYGLDGFRRPRLDQRRQDHGPLPAQGRAGGRLRRRHRAARPAPAQDRARRRTARGRLLPLGRPRPRRLALARRCCAARSSSKAAPSRATSKTASFSPARCRTKSEPARVV